MFVLSEFAGSMYRNDYEICPSWSPLDRLSVATLKEGSVVVVGTGQSATCDQYLHYEQSDHVQIFIPNISEVIINYDYEVVFAMRKL